MKNGTGDWQSFNDSPKIGKIVKLYSHILPLGKNIVYSVWDGKHWLYPSFTKNVNKDYEINNPAMSLICSAWSYIELPKVSYKDFVNNKWFDGALS